MRKAMIFCTGLAVALAGGVPLVAQTRDAAVAARTTLMAGIGAETRALGDMASGRSSFDATRAQAAQAEIARRAALITDRFRTEALHPDSEARPEIWTQWTQFAARASDLQAAAAALDPSSAASLRGGLAQLGAACRACHGSFRN